MESLLSYESGMSEYKIPINTEVYRKNYDYYSGMGIYSKETCKEKALLISGYRVVKPHDFDNLYQF